jgi:AcrR family transcriptional regulator
MSPRTAADNAKVRAAAREKILEAGLKVFARRGFHAATITDIAKAAGLSHGLVYHYFKTKDDIFLELVAIAFENSIAATKAAAAGKESAWDKIKRIAAMLCQNAFGGESPFYFYLMVQANILAPSFPALAALLAKYGSAYGDILAPLIKRAQREGKAMRGNPVILSLNFWALVQGLALGALQAPAGFAFTNPEILINLLRK